MENVQKTDGRILKRPNYTPTNIQKPNGRTKYLNKDTEWKK